MDKKSGVIGVGIILSSRRHDADGDRVVVELLMKNEEMKQLRGEMNDVHLFAERVSHVPSRVSLRGKNEATKYFLIPRQLRKDLAIRGKVSCQRLDNDGRSVFVYVVEPASQNISMVPTVEA